MQHGCAVIAIGLLLSALSFNAALKPPRVLSVPPVQGEMRFFGQGQPLTKPFGSALAGSCGYGEFSLSRWPYLQVRVRCAPLTPHHCLF